MKIKDFFKLVITVGVSQLAGLIGSLFTFSAIPTWYQTLHKPTFSPPNWVFSPVWTILYTLMGIAAFLVWQKGVKHKQVKQALFIFGSQLVLNALWSIIFFGFKSLLFAFFEIIFLWLAILGTILTFFRVYKPAAFLLIPYIFWVSFAAYLNYYIWILNK